MTDAPKTSVAQALKAITSTNSFKIPDSSLQLIRDTAASSTKFLNDNQTTISSLLKTYNEFSETAKRSFASVSQSIQYIEKNLKLSDEIAKISKKDIDRYSSLIQTMQDIYKQVDFEDFSGFGVNSSTFFNSQINNFTKSFNELLHTTKLNNLHEKQKLLLLDYPSNEYYHFNETIAAFSNIKIVQKSKDIEVQGADKLNHVGLILCQVNSELFEMWEGASRSLQSDNPDKQRHFLISIRTIVETLLDNLAPSYKIAQWSSDPIHYHKKKPTRMARISYICRNIGNGKLVDFMTIDLQAAIEMVDFLNKVHKRSVKITTFSLEVLQKRYASLVWILVMADMMNN